MQEATGVVPRELAAQPECPVELSYLWNWFCEVGTEASYVELDAWARVSGVTLQPYETKLLRLMATRYIKIMRGEK